MVKINKTLNLTVADVLKQRKLEKAREKEANIQRIRDLKFDSFVQNTARDMIKNSPIRHNVQVFDTSAKPVITDSISDNSVWAPWSKMFKKY